MSKDKIAQPRCPYCDVQPMKFGQNKMATPDGTIICSLWCGNCGTVLSITPIGQQAPKVIDPTSMGKRLIQM